MNVLSNLCAGTYGDMAVDHGALIDVCSDIDVGGRHDDGSGSEVCSSSYAGSSGHDPDLVLGRELPCGECVLVKERELSLGHVREFTQTESRQDYFLHLGIYFPLAVNFARNPESSVLKAFHHIEEVFYRYFHKSFSTLSMRSLVC